MSLFDDIDPHGDWATIGAAGQRISERLLALATPRSLAELRLDARDYEWLLEWARSSSRATVRRWLVDRTTTLSASKLNRQDAIGLVLFTVAAEVARRDAAEGYLWAAVVKRFGPAKMALFVQGQPTYELKSTFERVAARFQLRNVFGVAGAQNWYVSTYLQFGFTRRGIDQLPMWLAGHPLTESVQDLLHDDVRQSATFRKLFEDLRLYRRDNITVESLRRTIASSPWILPEWSDRLVEAARERMHLGAGSSPVADVDALPFVGAPRMSWEPGRPPIVHLPLEHLAQFLSDGTYHIDVGRERVGVLISNSEAGVTGATSIAVRLRAPAVTVTVRQAEDGSPVRAQEVSFWDADEDVSAYDLDSGRRIDAWNDPMPSARSYALILADDLELDPERPSYGLAAGHRIYYLPAGSEAGKVRLHGADLWEPLTTAGPRPPQPGWLRRIEVATIPRETSVEVGQNVRLQILNLDGTVRFVRCGAAPLNFTQEGTYGVSEPWAVMPNQLGAATIVSVGIEHEGSLRVRRLPITLDGSGALLLTDDGWAPMDKDAEATVASIESSRVRLVWREEDRERIAVLGVMAGATFIRRAWEGTSSIRGLPGYGGRLEIREPYNPVEGKSLVLAAGVVDPGVIEHAQVKEAEIEISLSAPIEPDDDYRCVVVDVAGGVHASACSADADGQRWRAPLAVPSPSWVAAAAIAYCGRRIGATCLEGLDALLMDAIHGESGAAERAAAFSRWLHVPVLVPRYRSKFERLTGDRPCEVLCSWLTDRNLPDGLVHDTSEEWLSTVRSFYLQRRGTMTLDAFGALWATLAEHDERDHPLTPLDSLDEISPLMFLRGVQFALYKQIAPNSGSIATFLWGAPAPEVIQSSLEEASAVMKVDQNFLSVGVAKPICDALFDGAASLEGWQWQNLETCLSVPSFRRYLCGRLLNDKRLFSAGTGKAGGYS